MGNAAPSWPVVLLSKGANHFVQLPVAVTPRQVTPVIVTDIEAYEAQELEWLSPWSAALLLTKG
eukprot:3432566-Lingulodinium_polyedra.AAC.1